MEIPATGSLMGTPASISASVDPHVDAIDVEPLLDMTGDQPDRIRKIFVTERPPEELVLPGSMPDFTPVGRPILPVSPTEYGGML
jgi:hypothetical protein